MYIPELKDHMGKSGSDDKADYRPLQKQDKKLDGKAKFLTFTYLTLVTGIRDLLGGRLFGLVISKELQIQF